MKAERSYPRFTVTKKAEASLRGGHPWVYNTEITDIQGKTENGCLVDVLSSKGTYLGTGLLSEKSKIRVRVLAANANEAFGAAFFEQHMRYAVDYRREVMGSDFPAAAWCLERRTDCLGLRSTALAAFLSRKFFPMAWRSGAAYCSLHSSAY